MRTTLNIDDRVLRRLKREAERSGVSLTEMVNRTLELGVERLHPEAREAPYRCPTFSMGVPASGALDLDKALDFAAFLEDEETLRKLRLRK